MHTVGRTLAFTPYYRAPEQVKGRAHDCHLDTWQVGLLLLHLSLGLPPFYYLEQLGLSEDEQQQRRSAAELDNPESPYCSLLVPLEKEFVRVCMQQDVTARPVPGELARLRYLRRRWVPLPDV